jgi:hypothetical protein
VFVIGGLLMAVVLFLEGGLMGLVDKVGSLFKRKPEQKAGGVK